MRPQREVLKHEPELAPVRRYEERDPRPRPFAPSNETCPLSGISRPAITRSNVVLPHPLGPRITTATGRRHFERYPVQREVGSEALRHVGKRDRRGVHLASRGEAAAPKAATGTKITADCSSASIATVEGGVLAMIV